MIIEIIKDVASICGAITTIMVLITALVKPIREKIFGLAEIKEGQKCLLRSEMLKIYYEHKDGKTIRQHSRENFDFLYGAYKALGGNSFIDDVYEEIREWSIRS